MMPVIKLSVIVLAFVFGFIGCAGSELIIEEPEPIVEPQRVVVQAPVDYDRIAQMMENKIDAELGVRDVPQPSRPTTEVVTPEVVTPTTTIVREIESDDTAKLRRIAAMMGDGFYNGDIEVVAAAYQELRAMLARMGGGE